jgi:hypothetical protein
MMTNQVSVRPVSLGRSPPPAELRLAISNQVNGGLRPFLAPHVGPSHRPRKPPTAGAALPSRCIKRPFGIREVTENRKARVARYLHCRRAVTTARAVQFRKRTLSPRDTEGDLNGMLDKNVPSESSDDLATTLPSKVRNQLHYVSWSSSNRCPRGPGVSKPSVNQP